MKDLTLKTIKTYKYAKDIRPGDVIINGTNLLPVDTIHDGFSSIVRFTFHPSIGGNKKDRTVSHKLDAMVEVVGGFSMNKAGEA